MGKNVAVFVDVANIFYAAKAAGVDIDYVTLLKAATAGRDFVRAYAYTGLDPENENQRNFHSFLARHGYKVVSKDIRKYGDGKVKANLDIELVVDMMKTARNLDVAIVVSGDGDFAPAIRAVQEMGVRVEVISFRGNTSSDLIEVADIFTDITQLAKVERGSSRSGRRVAEEEFDMAGTDIPDKQTEGTGTRQRRGRGRGRGTYDEVPSRTREAVASREPSGRDEPAFAGAPGPIVVLPGEKLSRVASQAASVGEDFEEVEDEDFAEAGPAAGQAPRLDENGEPRRRRRRGGRGRGRGRGRTEEGVEVASDELADTVPQPASAARPERPERAPRPVRPLRDLDEEPIAPRAPRPTPFGSIWDSQLGVPSAPAAGLGPIGPLPDEDEEEPEIPEYLLAERRRGPQGPSQGGRGRGGQGGRGMRPGYSAALDRERYGRGGLNRYGEPQGGQSRPQPQPQGRPQAPRRDDRPQQPVQTVRPDRQQRSEEWSEVPPEIEEMLRAQMASRVQRPPERPQGDRRREFERQPAEPVSPASETAAGAAVESAPARRRGRPPRVAAVQAPDAIATTDVTVSPALAVEAPATGARRGRPRRTDAGAAAAPTTAPTTAEVTSGAESASGEAPAGLPARRGGRRPAAIVLPAAEATPVVDAEAGARPRRGRPPKAASAAVGRTPASPETAPEVEPAGPARARRGRAAATPAGEAGPAAAAGSSGGARPATTRRRTPRSSASSE